MAYPAKLTEEAILDAAAALVDDEGIAALSLRTLGVHLDARAPSLYRYFPQKESLLRSLAARFMGELSRAVAGQQTLVGFAQAYRAYALAHPRRYATIFRSAPEAERPPLSVGLQAAEPLLVLATRLNCGAPLPLARALWSYLHGAVSLELEFMGRARPGLDADEAFLVGLRLLEDGVTATQRGSDVPP